MNDPDVSIILITYNDAKRLPRALQSLCDQTLSNIQIIVVDDASTDTTAKVVAEFQKLDSRIEYIVLPSNSGGCSAPRNAGLLAARGSWVMFCDSDDQMERHAAINLLIAVEGADADLGCGVAERIVGKRHKRWRADAHEPGTLLSIEERPRLLYDTICVNKIYRRSWLVDHDLKFFEGLLYEDQIFTMQCYLSAKRIAVIAQTVYFWSVDHLAEDRSITQQRDQMRNVQSRIAVNEVIDAKIADRPAIKRHKDIKFLSHDLYLYCVSMLAMNDEQAAPIARILAEYTANLDLRLCSELRPGLRIAIYHLLIGDLAGVRSAMRNIKWSAVFDVPVVRRAEVDLWACEHLDDGPPIGGLPVEWWLDVTELHPTSADFSQRPYCHRVTACSTQGREVTIAGETADLAADFVPEAAVTLQWKTRTGVVVAQAPVQWAVHSGIARWQWRGSWPKLPSGDGIVVLHIAMHGESNAMPIRSLNVSSPLSSGESGTVGWHSETQSPRWPRLIAAVLGRVLPKSHVILVAGDGPVDLNGAAALGALFAQQYEVIWVQHSSAPPAPAQFPVLQAGTFAHILRAVQGATVLNDGGPAPYAKWCRGLRITAAEVPPVLASSKRPSHRTELIKRVSQWKHLCLPESVAASQWSDAVDFVGKQIPVHPLFEETKWIERTLSGPTVLFLFAGDPDNEWIEIAKGVAAHAQVIVRRCDRRGVTVPAALRCWVRDGRDRGLAELIVNCDVVITDGAPATYVAAALERSVVFWPGLTPQQTLTNDVPAGVVARSVQQAVEFALQPPRVDAPRYAKWAAMGVGTDVDVHTVFAQVIP